MTPSTTAAPLDGIGVLDLTRYLSGLFATMLLADYGEIPRLRQRGVI